MVDLATYQKMHQQSQHIRDADDYPGEEKLSQEQMDSDDPPEGNFLLLLPATVRGFNMQAKQWGKNLSSHESVENKLKNNECS